MGRGPIWIVLEYLFACKPTKRALRNKREEKILVVAIEAVNLVASKPMGGMGFKWFPWGLIYQSDETDENIGHIGQIEENVGQAEKYRAI